MPLIVDSSEALRKDGITDWPRALRVYLMSSVIFHLLWEILQLPLYTIWHTQSAGQQAFAVVHCTLGDVTIAGLTLLIALASAAPADWPRNGWGRIAIITLALGVLYTIYSEWLNVNVRGSWQYSQSMPTLPWLGTGLSPLLQWVAVPVLAFLSVARRVRH